MAGKDPIGELDDRFGSSGAVPTTWAEVRSRLEQAEIYWLSTGRSMASRLRRRWSACAWTAGCTPLPGRNPLAVLVDQSGPYASGRRSELERRFEVRLDRAGAGSLIRRRAIEQIERTGLEVASKALK